MHRTIIFFHLKIIGLATAMEKKWKGDFDMGGLSVQSFFHFLEDQTKSLEIYLPMEPVQNLDKPAHVRALEMVRQVHIHIYRGNRLLTFLGFIQDRYRVGNRFDAYLLYIDPPVIYLALDILHVKSLSIT